jgi:ubiquinone/menaquinone biosynthesis C-methylase UbiE
MYQGEYAMTRLQATGVNAAQIESWNGAVGNLWAGDTFRERQNRAQGPFGDAAIEALGLQPGQHVLDIGCGSGSTTFELANRVGPSGRVVGVDISAPQLQNARKHAEAFGNPMIEFHNQDVATFPFASGTFDRAFSRFGVMFFAEPVDAFVHIRFGMKPGGRIAFVCWQSAEQNPWNTLAATVASQYLPPPAPLGPEDPSPYAFRDPNRVNRILSEAGFDGIEIASVERKLIFEPDVTGTVEQLMQYGMMASAIAQASEDIRERIKADLGEAIQGYQTSDGVMIDGAAWMVTAECPT